MSKFLLFMKLVVLTRKICLKFESVKWAFETYFKSILTRWHIDRGHAYETMKLSFVIVFKKTQHRQNTVRMYEYLELVRAAYLSCLHVFGQTFAYVFAQWFQGRFLVFVQFSHSIYRCLIKIKQQQIKSFFIEIVYDELFECSM